MSETKVKYTTIPYPKVRRATIGGLKGAKRKNMIHSIIEVDISNARKNLRKIKKETNNYISFTGYIIYCVSKAVDKNKIIHAYRNKKNQLILFNYVDVSTTIERKVDNNSEVVAMILRGANRKTVTEISEEIKTKWKKMLRKQKVFVQLIFFWRYLHL